MFRVPQLPEVSDFFSWIRLYALLDLAANTTTLAKDDRAYFRMQLMQLSTYFARGEWLNLERFEASSDLNTHLVKCPSCFNNLSFEQYMLAFDFLCAQLRESLIVDIKEKAKIDPVLLQTKELSKTLFSMWKKALKARNSSWYMQDFVPVMLADEIAEYCVSVAAEKKLASGGAKSLIFVVDDSSVHRHSCCPWWTVLEASKKTVAATTELSPLVRSIEGIK